MSVSERDRAYMARIGALKATSHSAAQTSQQALPVAERLRNSWALFLAYRSHANVAPSDGRAPALYARARALNLYRP